MLQETTVISEYSEQIPVCVWMICIHSSRQHLQISLLALGWVTDWISAVQYLLILFPMFGGLRPNIASKSDEDLCSLFYIGESVGCSILFFHLFCWLDVQQEKPLNYRCSPFKSPFFFLRVAVLKRDTIVGMQFIGYWFWIVMLVSFANWSYKGCCFLFWPLRVVFGCRNTYEEIITVSGPHWEGKNASGLNHPMYDGLEEQLDGPLYRLKWSALASHFLWNDKGLFKFLDHFNFHFVRILCTYLVIPLMLSFILLCFLSSKEIYWCFCYAQIWGELPYPVWGFCQYQRLPSIE